MGDYRPRIASALQTPPLPAHVSKSTNAFMHKKRTPCSLARILRRDETLATSEGNNYALAKRRQRSNPHQARAFPKKSNAYRRSYQDREKQQLPEDNIPICRNTISQHLISTYTRQLPGSTGTKHVHDALNKTKDLVFAIPSFLATLLG
jgi:hypothetical protein